MGRQKTKLYRVGWCGRQSVQFDFLLCLCMSSCQFSCRCLFSWLACNGWRYETLGISELLHYQDAAIFDARTKARIITKPPMFYDRVLWAGFPNQNIKQIIVLFSYLIIVENFLNTIFLLI